MLSKSVVANPGQECCEAWLACEKTVPKLQIDNTCPCELQYSATGAITTGETQTGVNLDLQTLDLCPALRHGAAYCAVSRSTQSTTGLECCYDFELKLITSGSGLGIRQRASPRAGWPLANQEHCYQDIVPQLMCGPQVFLAARRTAAAASTCAARGTPQVAWPAPPLPTVAGVTCAGMTAGRQCTISSSGNLQEQCFDVPDQGAMCRQRAEAHRAAALPQLPGTQGQAESGGGHLHRISALCPAASIVMTSQEGGGSSPFSKLTFRCSANVTNGAAEYVGGGLSLRYLSGGYVIQASGSKGRTDAFAYAGDNSKQIVEGAASWLVCRQRQTEQEQEQATNLPGRARRQQTNDDDYGDDDGEYGTDDDADDEPTPPPTPPTPMPPPTPPPPRPTPPPGSDADDYASSSSTSTADPITIKPPDPTTVNPRTQPTLQQDDGADDGSWSDDVIDDDDDTRDDDGTHATPTATQGATTDVPKCQQCNRGIGLCYKPVLTMVFCERDTNGVCTTSGYTYCGDATLTTSAPGTQRAGNNGVDDYDGTDDDADDEPTPPPTPPTPTPPPPPPPPPPPRPTPPPGSDTDDYASSSSTSTADPMTIKPPDPTTVATSTTAPQPRSTLSPQPPTTDGADDVSSDADDVSSDADDLADDADDMYAIDDTTYDYVAPRTTWPSTALNAPTLTASTKAPNNAQDDDDDNTNEGYSDDVYTVDDGTYGDDDLNYDDDGADDGTVSPLCFSCAASCVLPCRSRDYAIKCIQMLPVAHAVFLHGLSMGLHAT